MRYLCYMGFDWDNNILHMPTPIHIDIWKNNKWIPQDILPEEFSKIRKYENWRGRDNNMNLTFQEFRDIGPRGENAFFEDAKWSVLNHQFGPCFQDFINTLINGNIFLIITARGHEPKIMKNFVKWLVCHYMTQEQRNLMKKNLKKFQLLFNSVDESIESYLDTCEFVGVTSDYFINKYGINYENQSNVEHGKEIAINSFLTRLEKFAIRTNMKLKFGFSDDDENTIKHMISFLKEKNLNVAIDYYIFNTSNKKKKKMKLL